MRSGTAFGFLTAKHCAWFGMALGALLFCDSVAANPLLFDIPASEAPTAFRDFTRQAGLQLLFDDTAVSAVKTHAVSGRLEPEVALAEMLRGTGLYFEKGNDGTVAIRPVGATSRVAPAPLGILLATNTAAASAATASAASVDTPPNALPPPAAESEAPKLEEIVVSAERREESIQKVPMSLTAFSQKTMDDLHLQSFADLATVVPGLVTTAPTFYYSQANFDVAIRGIYSGGNAATTGIYIDETPIVIRELFAGLSGSPQPDIFDLERVEVLRGPQGTLFGSGAMGGAIRYITPQPNLENPSGYSKVEFGYTDRGTPSYAVGVAYGAPIIQGELGFRMSGWFHWDGGFIDIEDPYSGQILERNANASRTFALRPAFTFVPAEGLTITPAVFMQQRHSEEPDLYWTTPLPNRDSGAYVSGFGVRARQPATDVLTVPSVTIKYDFHKMSFQSDTSYLYRNYHDFDDDTYNLPPVFGLPPLIPALSSFASFSQEIEKTRAWQQEFRLTSQDPGSRLNWVLGAYYRHSLDELAQVFPPDLTPLTEACCNQTSFQYFGVPDFILNGQVLNAYTDFNVTTDQRALFGEISYDFFSRLKATVGARVERSAVYHQGQVAAGPLNGVPYTSVVLPDETQTPVTPRFSLSYQFTSQDMVYATAAKGFRPGGSNGPIVTSNPFCASSAASLGLTSIPTTFGSDSIWSYEVGTKDSFFDQRLVFQASAYYIDWTGIQTSTLLLSCGQLFTANHGKAVSQGFDLQFSAAITDHLQLGGTIGYTHAYYPNAEYGAASVASGTPPLIIGAGDPLPLIPPWTAAVDAQYTQDISRVWDGAQSYLRIDCRWTDEYPRADPNVANYDPEVGPYPNQAYETLNVRLGVTHRGLDLSAFVNNATDSRPLLGYFHSYPGEPLFSALALRPRTVGLTALYRF